LSVLPAAKISKYFAAGLLFLLGDDNHIVFQKDDSINVAVGETDHAVFPIGSVVALSHLFKTTT
jgi:hypothetical protein